MNSRQPLALDGESPSEVDTLQMPDALSHTTLRECVERVMERYFSHLEGESVSNLYTMVLAEVEAPLLEVVMRNVEGNQTRAAELLGLNRGTLRKKLKQYDLI
ncbi:DNA-binding transcriptional regulator Fis [Salinicola salarius]|uniref:DNA-binding transcriptional regulator Fis n=1 Tax=Salinicola salarius TaxID=430457 RepID=UPI0023E3FFB2|nr:DNA-binding transcriptional regulator Fis [Salinicola salarius]MDF3919092.1 DNA-binding transcriptional regulator Fis [Salinicola salarius]